MRRTVLDIIWILFIYATCCVFIYMAVVADVPQQLGVSPPPGMDVGDFRNSLEMWLLGVMAISFVMALLWYVLGAWLWKPYNTSHGKWVGAWLLLISLVIVAGIVAIIFGPQVADHMYVLALFYLGGGLLVYYVATVLFSPPEIKYTVIGSKALRRGW